MGRARRPRRRHSLHAPGLDRGLVARVRQRKARGPHLPARRPARRGNADRDTRRGDGVADQLAYARVRPPQPGPSLRHHDHRRGVRKATASRVAAVPAAERARAGSTEEGGGGRRLQRLGALPHTLAARARQWELERVRGGTQPQLARGRQPLPTAARGSWSGDARRHAHRREAPRSLRPGVLRLEGSAEVGDPVAARDDRVLRPGRALGGRSGAGCG